MVDASSGGCPAGRFYSFTSIRIGLLRAAGCTKNGGEGGCSRGMIARVRVAGETSTMSDVRVKKKHKVSRSGSSIYFGVEMADVFFFFSILPLLFLASFDSFFSSFGADSLI